LSTQLSRSSAACGLLSGLFLAIPGGISIFTGKTAGAAFVIALSPALAAPLLVAVYQRHSHVANRFGATAYLVNLIGLGLFGGAAFTLDTALIYLSKPVLTHLKHEPTIVALLGSGVVFAVGSVLFGIFLLRTGAYPRLLAWAYVLAPAVLALLSPLPDSPAKNAVHVLTGGTLVWLAVTLWRASVPGTADQAAASSKPRSSGPWRVREPRPQVKEAR
jgi:hypothetical protein